MSDLIDKDALLNSIYSDNPTDIMLYIAEFPSAVVRCKECKYFQTMKLFGDVEFCTRTGKEIERWLMVGADDYCSKGERRSE